MPVASKVRIYDLARDLKQDTKRIMEDLRREGADVSVPSNSVSKELAEKIRNKYFPKVETAPRRLVKVIKKKAETETEIPQIETPEIKTPDIETKPHETEIIETPKEIPVVPIVKTQPKIETPKVKALTKKVELTQPEETVVMAEEIAQPVEIVEETAAETVAEIEVVAETSAPTEKVETVETVEIVEKTEKVERVEEPQKPTDRVKILAPKVMTPKVFSPTGTQVKQLTLTKDALLQGIKPGDRVVSEAKTKTGKFDKSEKPKDGKREFTRDRNGRKTELRGTPGESANPIMTYTPNQNQRRPEGRGKKGGKTFELSHFSRKMNVIIHQHIRIKNDAILFFET